MGRQNKYLEKVSSGKFDFKQANLEEQMQHLFMGFFTEISQTIGIDNNLYWKLGLDLNNDNHKAILSNVLEYMVADGLIYPTGDNYKLTLHGYKVRQNEGYLKYLDKIDADRQRERDNIETSILTNKNVMLTNKIQWLAAGLSIAIISFSAYTGKQALSISRKDHYLEHIKLQQQQSQKEQFELKRPHRHNPSNDLKKAKTDTLKIK